MLVPIITKYDNRGAKKAMTAFDRLRKNSLKLATSIGLSTAAIEEFARRSVQAYMEDLQAQSHLMHVLKNAGFGEAATQANTYIEKLSRVAGVTDDRLRPAFINLFNATHDVATSQELLNRSLDISVGTGRDFEQVSTALAKAMTGNRKGLLTLGTGLQKAYLQTADLADIMAKLDQRFSGGIQANAETLAGKMAILQVAAGEASETIGGALVTAFTYLAGNGNIRDAASQIDNAAQSIANFITEVSGATEPTNVFTASLRYLADRISQIGAVKWFNRFDAIGKMIAGSDTFAPKLRMTDSEKARRAAISDMTKYYQKQKQTASFDQWIAELDKRNAAAAKKAAAEKAAAAAKRAKELAHELALKKLAAKYDVQLANLAAARKRTKDKGILNRLSDLTLIAQDQAGLPVSDAALAAAKSRSTVVNVNVQGSVLSERDLQEVVDTAVRTSSFGLRYSHSLVM